MQKKISNEIRRHLKKRDVGWLLSNAAKMCGIYLGAKRRRPMTGPFLGGLLVTYRCNHSCVFCDFPERGNLAREMSTDEWIGVIREFRSLGTSAIGFTGGEPVLRKDLWTLVREAASLGMSTSLASNGTLWTAETVEKMFDSGLHQVGFSLLSATRGVHDGLQRMPGAFDKVCEVIRRVDEYRRKTGKTIVISVAVNLNLHNLGEVFKIPDMAHALGVDLVNYIGMETGGMTSSGVSDSLDIRRGDVTLIDQIVDKLISIKQKTGIIDNSYDSLNALRHQARGKPLPVRCLAGYTSLYVDCYGNLYPCMAFMHEKDRCAGRYEKGKLREFWTSDTYQAFREKYTSRCRSCYWPCQNEMNYLFNHRAFDRVP